MSRVTTPEDEDTCQAVYVSKKVKLTSLLKIFWPDLGFTKRDLPAYYLKISPVLPLRLKDHAMVMKPYRTA